LKSSSTLSQAGQTPKSEAAAKPNQSNKAIKAFKPNYPLPTVAVTAASRHVRPPSFEFSTSAAPMSQTVREIATPEDAVPLIRSKEDNDMEGGEKPQAHWKGFVAGVFSGVAKLSGTPTLSFSVFSLVDGEANLCTNCSGTSVSITSPLTYDDNLLCGD
jgi:hypothetical protein